MEQDLERLMRDADAALGNRDPREAAAERRDRTRGRLRTAGSVLAGAGREVVRGAALEASVRQDEPTFPHGQHQVLSIVTLGLWLPVYVVSFQLSAQHRYRVRRRKALRAQGVGRP